DPSVELAILDGIRREMTASTLLLIAYRKSTISLADRVVFLDHGRVADAGTHEELRGRSHGYRALVDAYDEAAISHNLLESSGPQPSDGPDPSIAVPAARARTVADAVEHHGTHRHRHEESGGDDGEREAPTETGAQPAGATDAEGRRPPPPPPRPWGVRGRRRRVRGARRDRGAARRRDRRGGPMTAAPAARSGSSALGAEATAEESALHTVRRGLALTPNALQGLWITILLAVLATAGKVVVPIAVQSILDRGIIEPETPDLAFVSGAAALAALVLLSTAVCNIVMNRRLFRLAETSLATLRKRAFRHIHDLS